MEPQAGYMGFVHLTSYDVLYRLDVLFVFINYTPWPSLRVHVFVMTSLFLSACHTQKTSIVKYDIACPSWHIPDIALGPPLCS